MKRLKKALLINWLYFDKQWVELDDINFLTGKNSAGKSTFIDALQVVLLGEAAGRSFNKAANKDSERTVGKYLRADNGSGGPYSRRGKSFNSYIACQFEDDDGDRVFTIGIVFECGSDNSESHRFFLFEGPIPEDAFVKDRQAMDISALRRFFKEHYPNRHEIFDSPGRYREAILARFNVHTDKMFRMLKRAVSFEPIVDIQKFITENICDVESEIDIAEMQENIREYKRQEQLAKVVEDKVAALREIASVHQDMQSRYETFRTQSYLVAKAEKETITARIDGYVRELETGVQQLRDKREEYAALILQIQSLQNSNKQLIADKANNSIQQKLSQLEGELSRAQERIALLEREMDEVIQTVRRSVLTLFRYGTTLNQCLENGNAGEMIPDFQNLSAAWRGMRQALERFEQLKAADFERMRTQNFENGRDAVTRFLKYVRDNRFELSSRQAALRDNLREMEREIGELRHGVKAYDPRLLRLRKAIRDGLMKLAGKPVAVDILADVIDIKESRWRNAVEGYLHTQKFYLLVEPEWFVEALKIYDRIKFEEKIWDFGLVDVGKMREQSHLQMQPKSLAEKIKTDNPLARDYLTYLLEKVICCERVEDLRTHAVAITADGMLYQGYVARQLNPDRWKQPYIGQQSIEQTLTQKEQERLRLVQEIKRREELVSVFEQGAGLENFLAGDFIPLNIGRSLNGYAERKQLQKQCLSIQTVIDKLDLTWLSALDKKISETDQAIKEKDQASKKLYAAIDAQERRNKELKESILPDLQRQEREKQHTVELDFTETFIRDIGQPRYQTELRRLGRPGVILNNFQSSVRQTEKNYREKRDLLQNRRYAYATRFPPCPFAVDDEKNDSYQKELENLERVALPQYQEKIKKAKDSAMDQFQNDFIAKLKSNIETVRAQVDELNRALRSIHFSADSYAFHVDKNSDYADYYAMITDPELMGEGRNLFSASFQEKHRETIDALFSRIAAADDKVVNARKQSELEKSIALFTDYRTYLKFDLEVCGADGHTQLLSQTLNIQSGGGNADSFLCCCAGILRAALQGE